jgi:hypothetical protein
MTYASIRTYSRYLSLRSSLNSLKTTVSVKLPMCRFKLYAARYAPSLEYESSYWARETVQHLPFGIILTYPSKFDRWDKLSLLSPSSWKLLPKSCPEQQEEWVPSGSTKVIQVQSRKCLQFKGR